MDTSNTSFFHKSNIKSWLNLINSNQNSDFLTKAAIYETAILHFPGSFKLWNEYLLLCREFTYSYMNSLSNLHKTSKKPKKLFESINTIHERALIYMSKMPTIWIDYLDYLIYQKESILKIRNTFNSSIQSLPITQHETLWSIFIKWANSTKSFKLINESYERYLCLNSKVREEYISILVDNKEFDLVIKNILIIINDERFVSIHEKSKFYYLKLMCQIITRNDLKLEKYIQTDIENIIKNAIDDYPFSSSFLYLSLIAFYIKQSRNFTKARQLFEEGLLTIHDKKQFYYLFNSYLKFESDISKFHIEENMLQLKTLLLRRPFLFSNLNLKHNPFDVDEYLKRALFINDFEYKRRIFDEGIENIDIDNSLEPERLYIEYARLLEENNRPEQAVDIYYKAMNNKSIKKSASNTLLCHWIEMYLRLKKYKTARELCKRICTETSSYSSFRLWCLYAEIENIIGTKQGLKEIYTTMIRLNLVNIEVLFNNIELVKEESMNEVMRLYELGLSILDWPELYVVWINYLDFYISSPIYKIEVVREMLDTLISSCPKDYIKLFIYFYSFHEEEKGSIINSLDILYKGIKEVNADDKKEVCTVLISKSISYGCIDKARNTFLYIIDNLNIKESLQFCLKFANYECKLGEIDRARSIYKSIYSYIDDIDDEEKENFWIEWEEFELYNGVEESYKEMLIRKNNVMKNFSNNYQMYENLKEN